MSDPPTLYGLALFPADEVSSLMRANIVHGTDNYSLIYDENNNQASDSKNLVVISAGADTQACHSSLCLMRSSDSPMCVSNQVKRDPWLQHKRIFTNE